ncbi:MAG: thioredoxin domain-containing protein [Balneolaceae bacterium]
MKTKDKISLAFTGILVICAIVITGFVIRQEFFPPEPQLNTQQVEKWQQLELKGQKTGPENASVQIIEFFDYECPFCKSVQPAVQAIQQKYPGEVSVAYEHFPLSGHNFAFEAAVAAECAGKQKGFKSYHDLLFTHQDQIGIIPYESLATEADLADMVSFKRCIEEEETAEIVQSGLNLAEEHQINSIPTFIINGKVISGALSEQQLEGLVRKALAETK